MAYPEAEGTRVNRSKYWLMFFVTMVATIVLIGVSIGSVANGDFGLAIVAFLLIAPVNLYFRVIMMRRCRDLGWPAALPWITFGLGIAASVFSFGSLATFDPSMMLGGSGFSMLVSLADLVLMIALGSIRGRTQMDYQEVFGGFDEQTYRPAPQQRTAPAASNDYGAPKPSVANGDSDAMDDAIARALDNYKRTGSAVPQQAAAAPSPIRQKVPQPAAGLRAGGFGRKMV